MNKLNVKDRQRERRKMVPGLWPCFRVVVDPHETAPPTTSSEPLNQYAQLYSILSLFSAFCTGPGPAQFL